MISRNNRTIQYMLLVRREFTLGLYLPNSCLSTFDFYSLTSFIVSSAANGEKSESFLPTPSTSFD